MPRHHSLGWSAASEADMRLGEGAAHPVSVAVAAPRHLLAAFLTEHGEQRWSEQAAEEARLLRAGDPGGITSFLSKFGGTGSLNDLVFRPKAADDLFSTPRDEAWWE